MFSQCAFWRWSTYASHLATWRFCPLEEWSQEGLSCCKGPYQIQLTNPFAAKLRGTDSWIHIPHLKNKTKQNKNHTHTKLWRFIIWWLGRKYFPEFKCGIWRWHLKLRSLIPTVPLFFFIIILAIWNLLFLYKLYNFFCSNSVKNAIGYLIRIALNL